jgi:hypothetical protein
MIIPPKGRTVHFGSKKGKKYVDHKNDDLKRRWIARHQVRENWTKSGIDTAGFWSRWLLWSEPSIEKAVKKIEEKFNIKISVKI